MRQRNQIVQRPMNDLDSLPAHFVRNLPDLRGAFVVPPRRQRLADEPCPRERLIVRALGQLLRCEAVAVCGEVAVAVRFVEPAGAYAGFDFGDLGVDGFRDAMGRGIECETRR